MGRIIHSDKEALEKANRVKERVYQIAGDQGEVLSILDKLRATRAARGGVGEPLIVPAHLKDASEGKAIVITDEDLKP